MNMFYIDYFVQGIRTFQLLRIFHDAIYDDLVCTNWSNRDEYVSVPFLTSQLLK